MFKKIWVIPCRKTVLNNFISFIFKFSKIYIILSVTCLAFGKDISHLLAASIEIKVLGLKSGKMIKEFRGTKIFITILKFLFKSSFLIRSYFWLNIKKFYY